MKNADRLKEVLDEFRNGYNDVVKAGFYPLAISDGAKDAVEAAGCWWLIDILGTEVAPKLIRDINSGEQSTVLVEFKSDGSKGVLRVTDSDTGPVYFQKKISYTDFPKGEWLLFEMGALTWDDAGHVSMAVCHLISEH